MFRIQGIQLSAHVTFLLLLGYVGWQGWQAEGIRGAVTYLAFVLVFFSCVVLHELGHAFIARGFGVAVPRILLLPIGGMAEFSRVPRRPAQEILIALAGPAVNFAIILVLSFFTQIPSWRQIATTDLEPLQLLFVMNLMMGCFNLLPAFPMDGGRVLRAVLAQHLRYVRATRWAVAVGKIVALAGIAVMIWLPEQPHWMGAVLFTFIMISGEMEYRAVRREEEEERQWRQVLEQWYQHPRALPPRS